MPQIVQIGPIVQKHTWTRLNCQNEADLTYLGMLDGSFCMLTNKVDLLNRRQEKQIYRLVKIVEEYDKTTQALKEGFGATLKASFAGWDTPDRYRRWNKLDFSEFVKIIRRPIFFCEKCPQEIPKLLWIQETCGQYMQISAVHACDKSHQIAACWNENSYFCKLCMLETNDFKYSLVFLHASGFESLGPKSPTQTLQI